MSTASSPSFRGFVVSSRYRILKKLGSGSVGTVYLAHDELGGGPVALKVIQAERLGDEGLAGLQEEFRAIAGLQHPGIAAAHDFGYTESGGLPFYTREYIPGQALAPGPPDTRGQAHPERFLKPILDLLDALEYLHAHEILHLDIHSGNVIETPRIEGGGSDGGRGAVLIDLGLPRHGGVLGTGPAANDSGSSFPPELLRGEPPRPSTDLFAVGRLLLYRLTGRHDGDAKLPGEIPGWGERRPLELERIVGKALHENPEQRFTSAREFREALAVTLGGSDRRATRAEPGELSVGRDEELETIDEILEETAAGATRVLCFAAPPGLGKTRLLTEARWRAQLKGLEVADVRFPPTEGAAPRLATVLRSLPSAKGGAAWLSPLATGHGGSTQERAQRAAESFFVETGFAETDPIENEPPLVLLLDDLELADRESRLLAEALIAECVDRRQREVRGRGLAILVGSVREPGRRALGSRPRGLVRKLKPLSRKTSTSLLQTLLRPLSAPASLLARFAAETRGHPLRIRQLAHALHEEHGPAGNIPEDADFPHRALDFPGLSTDLREQDPARLQALKVLAVFGRAVDSGEIGASCGLPRDRVSRALRRLVESETVVTTRHGRRQLYYLRDPSSLSALIEDLSARESAGMHRRAADYLGALSSRDLREMESLSRHLLAARQQRAGRDMALKTADELCRRRLPMNAVRLLEETAANERTLKWQRILAERISDLYAAGGDHPEGIAALEPLYRNRKSSLKDSERVRLCRRLGVHHHRAGDPRRAADLFREALKLADSRRDIAELVFIHSELAELHTFQGDYRRAEEACRTGLQLLDHSTESSAEFRGEMEVTLRATLGHLELRRLNLHEARSEFAAALSLTHSHGTVGLRALILNNLGIVHNQLNDFERARGNFRQAERLLAAAGERNALIHIACNLAIIAAKRGKAAEASEEIDKAARLLREHPGERLEFFLAVSRAVTQHHLGVMTPAIDGFRRALPLGRKFGDTYLVRFSEVYLAEAEIACGRYVDARRSLQSILAHARTAGPPVLVRMAASRSLLLAHLTGREREATRVRRVLEETPRTPIDLLETWNDLFLAMAAAMDPEAGSSGEATPLFDSIAKSFEELDVPAGHGLARVGQLGLAIRKGSADLVRGLLIEIERGEDSPHRMLSVIEPLACAEACFLLGDLDRCGHHLQRAASSMVGQPFIELDWRIEYMRARLAERLSDREDARHYLHRCLQVQEFLGRSLPAKQREALLKHPRFRPLDGFRARLERFRLTRSTPGVRGPGEHLGLIGSSAPMRTILQTVRKLEDLDMPVLITGETGTGKELVARAVHQTGPRRRGPFFSLHCASLPPELFESELFGYEAGAFTGAEDTRTGLLEHLDGGTLLLDDITQLSSVTQAKLLQVLDTHVVRPLGSLDVKSVDVRFLASTSQDVDDAIQRGAFREDLFHRLRGAMVHLPPLRTRPEDIPELIRHFFQKHGRRLDRAPPILTRNALDLLRAYPWPGNVRELESLIIRLIVTSTPGTALEPSRIHGYLTSRRPSLFPEALLEGRDLKDLRRELDRAYLLKLFRSCEGDIPAMAQTLAMKRSNLYTWMRKVGIDVRSLRRE